MGEIGTGGRTGGGRGSDGQRSGAELDFEAFRRRDDRLADVMARLAAGDGDALGDLLDEFHVELERVVLGLARHRRARLGREEVRGLVVDAALDVAEVAGGWRPDGAPPWHWARHRIANRVDETIGQWADPIDGDGHDAPAVPEVPLAPSGSPDGGETVEAVDRLALSDPRVALLDEALRRVASPRDRRLFYETICESVAGTRGHADVVARLHGLPPATVRQQFHRVKVRIRRLAETDERFAALIDLPAVA